MADTSGSHSAFLAGGINVTTSLQAYLGGESTAIVTQAPVEVLVQPDTQAGRITQAPVEVLVQPDTQAARVSQIPVEVLLENIERTSLSAYLDGDPPSASSSLPAFLVTDTKVEVAQAIAYVETEQKKLEVAQAIAYVETEQKKIEVAQALAYAEVQDPYPGSDSLDAYLSGSGGTSDSLSSYMEGGTTGTPASSSTTAYLSGIVRGDTPAYTKGKDTATSSLPAYTYSGTKAADSFSAFLEGTTDVTSTLSAFLWSSNTTSQSAYLSGGYSGITSQDAYAHGRTSAQDSLSAYTASGYRFSALSAYTYGYIRTSLPVYLYCGTKVITSLDAFTKAEVNTTTALDAFISAHEFSAATRPAYLMAGTSTTDSTTAFLYGKGDTLDKQFAYCRGELSSTDSLDAYIKGGTFANDSTSAYLLGIPLVESSRPCFMEGSINFVRTSLNAYAEGIYGVVYWQSAYALGAINPVDSMPAFLWGGINVTSSLDVYIEAPPLISTSAYLEGVDTDADTLDAFTEGLGYETSTSQDAFLEGKLPGISSTPAFLEGYPAYFPDPVSYDAYTNGILGASDFYGRVWIVGQVDATPASQDAYLYGHIPSIDNTGAYARGIVANFRGSMKAFIGPPVERSSLSCFSEGLMVEYNYIILASSNDSISEQFRVVAQGYDDGSLEKSASVRKTIGGGLDVSMGDTYTTWNPTIRVRHEEDESGFGILADLVALYKLSDPGGTPTNVITFTDNHGVEHAVYMLGNFKKQYLGAHIEGNQAWLFVKLQLVEKA